jgi:hypothetical protein
LSRSLAAALVSRGFSKPVAVAESTTLRRFAQDPTRDRLSSLADRTAGHVDIVLLVEGRARFASRMSDTRVWYDAQGKLSAYNAWTGAVVATIETSVTASGVGDRRAEAAAREQLATALAELYLGKQALLAAAVPAVRHP